MIQDLQAANPRVMQREFTGVEVAKPSNGDGDGTHKGV